MKRLYRIFAVITVLSFVFLVGSFIKDSEFKNSDLSASTYAKIKEKGLYLQKLAFKNYNINIKIPILISSKMNSQLFGVAVQDENNKISIVLNKKRFQESEEYMIDSVLPHEYAHALMFAFKKYPKENSGHSKEWQNICKTLEGLKCARYVKNNDIVFGKVRF